MREILFIKLNPIGTKNLYLDVEEKALVDAQRKSTNRDSYAIVSKGAVAITELHEYLEEYKPTILHISGHGNEEGELLFHDSENHIKDVSIDKFCQFIKNYNTHLKCIFLNACFSITGIEEAEVGAGQAIIGMNKEVPNDTAVLFSRSFYTSLFGGKDIHHSFQSALGVVGIDGFGEEAIPVKIGTATLEVLSTEISPDHIELQRSSTELVSQENFELARAKRLKQKKSFYYIVAGVIFISLALALGTFFTSQGNNKWFAVIGGLPLGLIKWIKNKVDGIDDSLMLLKMLENEISGFVESFKRPPVERMHERAAQYNEQFWRILDVNR